MKQVIDNFQIDQIHPEIWNAIIGAVLLLIGTLIGFLYKVYLSRKGNFVKVSLEAQTPQVSVGKDVESNLKILYSDNPVENIVLSNLSIRNMGDIDLEEVMLDISITDKDGLILQEAENVFKVNIKDPANISNIDMHYDPKAEENKEFGHHIKIYRTYLNRYKAHKDEEIIFNIFSGIPLSFNVSGGGKGWGTKFVDTTSKSSSGKNIIILFLIFGIYVGLMFILINYIFTYFNLSPFTSFLGGILLLVVSFFLPFYLAFLTASYFIEDF